MLKIIDASGSGKTKHLMLEALKLNLPILCKNPDRLAEKASCYGISGVRFLPYDYELSGNEQFLVDDLDKYLEFKMPNIAGFNLSID